MRCLRCLAIVTMVSCWLPAYAPGAQEPLEFSTFHTSVRSLIFKEILSEAYGRLGIRVTVTPYPAKRGLSYADKGQLDGEAGRLAHIAQTYPNLRMIPVPIYQNRTTAFVRDPSLKITGWEDMRPYRINSMFGLKYTESRLRDFDRVEFVPTIQQAFRKLAKGRTDIVVFALLDGLNVINELSLKNITAVPFEQIPSYHFIHQKHKALIPAITEALTQMQGDGRLREIAQKYKEQLERGGHFDIRH